MRRLIAAAVAVVVATVGASQFASAGGLPTGCQLSTSSRSVTSTCSGGGGYYRAAAKYRWSSGAYSYAYDNWERPGFFSESYINAPSGATIVAGYLQKKYG